MERNKISKKSFSEKNYKNSKYYLVIVQLISCTFIIVGILLSKYLNYPLYNKIKSRYTNTMISNSIDISKYKNYFSNVSSELVGSISTSILDIFRSVTS